LSGASVAVMAAVPGGITPVVRTFTVSGSDTAPAGATSLNIKLWGPGGGGARDVAGSNAFAGNSGAYVEHNVAVTGGVTVTTYVIGNQGLGKTATDGVGTDATASTVAGLGLSAGGGGGGAIGSAGSTAAASGGNVANTSGNVSSGFNGQGAPNGGGNSGIGNLGTTPGGGGGASAAGNGRNGGVGQITLTYT
jgi:hypothetical protein